MNKKVIKKILSVALCGILAISMTACGGGIGGTKGSESLSSLINQKKPVIFYQISEMDKDNKPSQIYCFENGRVTQFDNISTMEKTLGEFSQMKDEEIIKLATETQKEKNKRTYQNKLEDSNKSIVAFPENEHEKRLVNFNGEYYKYFLSTRQMADLYGEYANYDENIFSSPFEIVIGTDASGNVTETEKIHFANPKRVDISENNITIPYLHDTNNNSSWGDDIELEEGPAHVTIRPIYDNYYATFKTENGAYFITKVGKNTKDLTLDPVGTKGTVLEKPTDEFRNKVAEELAFRYAELKKNCPKITTLVGR